MAYYGPEAQFIDGACRRMGLREYVDTFATACQKTKHRLSPPLMPYPDFKQNYLSIRLVYTLAVRTAMTSYFVEIQLM